MSSGLDGNQGRHGVVRRIIERVHTLSDETRVMVYTGASLLGIAIVIVAIVYRTEVWRSFLLLLGAAFLVFAVGALGYGLFRLNRSNRIKREAAQRSAADAQRSAADARLLWERDYAEMLRAVSAGEVLPLSGSTGVFLRNSEALWYHCFGVVFDRKGESHSGELFVTSLRILFVSAGYPFEIPISSVNAANIGDKSLSLIGKTASVTQEFFIVDPQMAAAHIERSVKAYHRQVDVSFEEGVGRHVPQDVKTAVWQRDGGKCVQCGATDYLEFDHIIPHAKGGASTVDNVQLLCRRCNLKKAAAI